MSFADTAGAAFANGPAKYRHLENIARYANVSPKRFFHWIYNRMYLIDPAKLGVKNPIT